MGKGSFGDVFLVRRRKDDRQFVLKKMHVRLPLDTGLLGRILSASVVSLMHAQWVLSHTWLVLDMMFLQFPPVIVFRQSVHTRAHSHSLVLSLSRSLALSLSRSLAHCLSCSLALSLSLSLFRSLALSLSRSLALSIIIALLLSLSLIGGDR